MEADIHPTNRYHVDIQIGAVHAAMFDGLLLPGGITCSDCLRMDRDTVRFVREFVKAGQPIAAISHGPWPLIEAGGVGGRTLTSWPSLRTDLTNAGGNWVDRDVVTDGMLVTSRHPDDLKVFCTAIVALFAMRPIMVSTGHGAVG